jgi:DNA polymerase-3 subunit epsilon
MAKIKFFDTETTGLPDWKEPSEAPQQPHLVQLAAILVDTVTMQEMSLIDNVIIKPDGWVIEPDMIHGISHEQAMDVGIPEVEALDMYLDLYRQCELRVAHNTTFDNRIMRIAMKRYRPDLVADDEWKAKDRYHCTMLEYSKVYGGKWPKLEEAYERLMGKKLEGAHTAMADTRACMDVYFALQAMKVAA